MVEVRMRQQHLVDDVNAVRALEFQQRRHYAHAAVDERVADDRPLPPLDQRVGDVRLPVWIGAAFVGPRAAPGRTRCRRPAGCR